MGDPEAALRVEVYSCPPCKPVTTSRPEVTTVKPTTITLPKVTGTSTEILGKFSYSGATCNSTLLYCMRLYAKSLQV